MNCPHLHSNNVTTPPRLISGPSARVTLPELPSGGADHAGDWVHASLAPESAPQDLEPLHVGRLGRGLGEHSLAAAGNGAPSPHKLPSAQMRLASVGAALCCERLPPSGQPPSPPFALIVFLEGLMGPSEGAEPRAPRGIFTALSVNACPRQLTLRGVPGAAARYQQIVVCSPPRPPSWGNNMLRFHCRSTFRVW